MSSGLPDRASSRRIPRGGALRRGFALLALGVGLSLGVGPTRVWAEGQPPTEEARAEVPRAAREVYDGVMSPFCPELLLANCPSPQADSLRRAIAVRAAAGETRAHLEADLLATYGDVVRAAPPGRGFGLVAWLAPAALLAAAGGWVTRWSRRSAHRGAGPEAPRHRADRPLAVRGARAGGRPPNAPPTEPRGGSADELAALEALLRQG